MNPSKIFNRFLLFSVTICWVFISAISILHLYPLSDIFIISTFRIGIIGWIGLIATLLFLCRHYIGKAFIIFFFFFTIGYFVGPFLEPPGDPIDHLQRTYAIQNETSNNIASRNHGFWHYSMSGIVLCQNNNFQSPDQTMKRINVLNGIFFGLGMVSLYILGRSVMLPDQWIFVSMIIALLFFGTNRFSYFSYYSFAPSFTSMIIYWLWTAVFFLKRNAKDIVFGLLIACLCLPVLVVNHFQEAIFLCVLVLIWLLYNVYERIWEKVTATPKKIVIIILSFSLFFILPQFEFFRNILSPLFIIDHWDKNKELVFSLWKFHLIGKVWSYRVNDTLGLIGFLPLFFVPVFLWPGIIKEFHKRKIRIIILGIIPFIVFFIPLIHYIWVSNCKWIGPHQIRYYYRICYASMFWIPITYLLFKSEKVIYLYLEKLNFQNVRNVIDRFKSCSLIPFFRILCLITILVVGSIRQAPFYGKLDFILLNSKVWESEWRPLLSSIIPGQQIVYSDRLTSNILSGIYNHPVVSEYYASPEMPRRKLIIIDMDAYCKSKSCRSIINLHGFKPSWVSTETGHWKPELADTSLYYTYKNRTGNELIEKFRNNPPDDYEIFY